MKTVFKNFSINKDMKINILSKDFDLSDAIQMKIIRKMESLDKYMKGKKDVQVILSTESSGHKIEVVMETKSKTLRTQSTTEDLYKSIDLISDNLKHQLSDLSKSCESKDKNNRHSIRYMEYKSKIQTDESEPKIVKRKIVPAKPMYEDEAILQMETLNHRSFIFINAETFKPCMLYKRHNGDYGSIELL